MKQKLPDLRSINKTMNRYGKLIRTAIAIIVLLVAVFLFGVKGENDASNREIFITQDDTVEIFETIETVQDSTKSTIEEAKTITCDISGEVKSPGVYTLDAGSRLNDLITMAGGLTEEANIDVINRAAELTDGIKIFIPNINDNQYSSSVMTESYNMTVANNKSGPDNGKISINNASLEELQKIPGVGPVTAQKIVEYRENAGGFSSIDELLNISGIGEKTYKKIQDYVIL